MAQLLAHEIDGHYCPYWKCITAVITTLHKEIYTLHWSSLMCFKFLVHGCMRERDRKLHAPIPLCLLYKSVSDVPTSSLTRSNDLHHLPIANNDHEHELPDITCFHHKAANQRELDTHSSRYRKCENSGPVPILVIIYTGQPCNDSAMLYILFKPEVWYISSLLLYYHH